MDLRRSVLAFVLCLHLVHAYTTPEMYARAVAFRDAMRPRSPNWREALQKWTCPTPPDNSVPPGSCDPCGQKQDGNWYHMHCRGNSRGWGESGDGVINGIITNMHITSEEVDGPVPKELCVIPTIREHDFGGEEMKGHLSGPIPRFLARCYPDLEELDLSNNRAATFPETGCTSFCKTDLGLGTHAGATAVVATVIQGLSQKRLGQPFYGGNSGSCYPNVLAPALTGTLPPYLSTMPKISEIKFENNAIVGTIPPQLGNIKRLRRFQAEFNNMHGPIPETFKNVRPYLTQFHLARNNFEGNLSMIAGGHLTTVTVHANPKLCGMVPATVRYAKGYNPIGTGLGKPCPEAASSGSR